MTDDYIEVYGYWDGPLSGVYFENGELFYFQLKDESALYPSDEDPDGRIYDVWRMEHEPFLHQVEDVNWQPDGTPFNTVTEHYLKRLPSKQTK